MQSKYIKTVPALALSGFLGFLVFAAHSFADSREDALILVAADSAQMSVVEKMNSRITIASVIQSLKPSYGSFDTLNSVGSTTDDLANLIAGHTSARAVDVFVLSQPGESVPGFSKIHFSNLRLIYFATATSPTQVQNWRRAGAQFVVAQTDFTKSSSMTSARFIRNWADGASAEFAAQDAEQYSQKVEEAVRNVVSSLGATSLQMEGLDTDRTGKQSGYYSLNHKARQPSPVQGEIPGASQNKSKSTGLKSAMLTATSALVPSLQVNPEKVSDSQTLLSLLQPIAWSQIQNLFSTGTSTPSSVNTTPFATEVWVEGDLFKYMFDPISTWMDGKTGGKFTAAMDLLQGVKATRVADGIQLAIYFSKGFDIQLKDPNSVSNFQLYAVHIPKTVRAELSNQGSIVKLTDVDQAEGETEDHLFLEVKIPVISDKVYLRNGTLDISSGEVLAEAGVLGDSLGLSGKAQVFSGAVQPKLDIWQTIQENLPLLDWTDLIFHTGKDSNP